MSLHKFFQSRLLKGTMAFLFLCGTQAQGAHITGIPGFYGIDYTTPTVLPQISRRGLTFVGPGSADSTFQSYYANKYAGFLVATASGWVDNRSNGNMPHMSINDANVVANVNAATQNDVFAFVNGMNRFWNTTYYAVTQDRTPGVETDFQAYAAVSHVEYIN